MSWNTLTLLRPKPTKQSRLADAVLAGQNRHCDRRAGVVCDRARLTELWWQQRGESRKLLSRPKQTGASLAGVVPRAANCAGSTRLRDAPQPFTSRKTGMYVGTA